MIKLPIGYRRSTLGRGEGIPRLIIRMLLGVSPRPQNSYVVNLIPRVTLYSRNIVDNSPLKMDYLAIID